MEVISDVQSQFYMGHHSTEHNGKQLLDYVFLEKKIIMMMNYGSREYYLNREKESYPFIGFL